MSDTKQSVFITGGAGLIGSYICRNLLARGVQPIVFDAFVQYISPLDSLYQNYLTDRFRGIREQVVFVRGDTRNKDDVRRAILKHRPERIIHLAALPIADLSNHHSEEALSSILQGAVNVMEVVRDVDFIKRFVYTSSSMVYGDFQRTPADEEHPKKPKDVYGGTKYAGEVMVETFGRRYGIEYTIIRPSAVYGPTDVNRRVSQIFVENALKGKPLMLHRGGDNTLDFTYVEDTADGFVRATFAEEARNEVFNITRGEGRTLKDFVTILRTMIPNIEVKETEGDLFRPKRGSLDISKAKRLLGYQPKYSLEDGLKIYVEFVRAKVAQGLL